MKHIKAFGLKFVLIAVVLLPILSMYEEAGIGEVIGISFIVTAIGYAVGDLLILPRSGNLPAALADFGITFIVIWLFGALLISPVFPMVYVAFGLSLILAFNEMFFHVHLEANVFEFDKAVENSSFINRRYLAEFAEEPTAINNQNKERT